MYNIQNGKVLFFASAYIKKNYIFEVKLDEQNRDLRF